MIKERVPWASSAHIRSVVKLPDTTNERRATKHDFWTIVGKVQRNYCTSYSLGELVYSAERRRQTNCLSSINPAETANCAIISFRSSIWWRIFSRCIIISTHCRRTLSRRVISSSFWSNSMHGAAYAGYSDVERAALNSVKHNAFLRLPPPADVWPPQDKMYFW